MKFVRYFDPVVAESIAMRYPVPGASIADKIAAAQQLARQGATERNLANIFDIDLKTASRWLTSPVLPCPDELLDLLDTGKTEEDSEPIWLCSKGHPLAGRNLRDTKENKCATCYAAKMEIQREKRKAKREPVPGDRHDAYIYQKLGCRCDTCRQANTIHQREVRAKRKGRK